MKPYPKTLEPAELGPIELRNRIIMGSMHTGLEHGSELGALAEFYFERAKGGAGLIVTGGVSPNLQGALAGGGPVMMSEKDASKHEIVTRAVHEAGGRIALQLLHAGRYAVNPNAVAPSPIKAPISPFVPQEMSGEQVEQTIEDFARAAELAKSAGYDGVEIMGSEGYLINQFLVTRTNQREDEWGGDYQNRMRFPLAITSRIRERLGPDFGIIFRISLLDLVEDGSVASEIEMLARALEKAGADALSSGFGWHEARIPTIAGSVPPTAFLDLTARLKTWVDIPVIAANRFFEPEQIEAAIHEGKADFVAMARPFLADARFVEKAKSDVPITPCIACNQACLDRIFSLKPASCMVNPRAGRELEMKIAPAKSPKRIAIIGAGPAGISAALLLAERGHHVTLFEQSDKIGGQLRLAAKIPGKEDFARLLDYYHEMIERLQIVVRFEAAEIKALDEFDEIIIATGVVPRALDIPKAEGARARPYDELLQNGSEAGRIAILGSGPIGFDVASFLLEEPQSIEDWREDWGVGDPAQARGGLAEAKAQSHERELVMLQRSKSKFGKSLGKTTGWIHRARLRKAGVEQIGGVSYEEIKPGALRISDEEGAREIAADEVIICAGQESERSLYDALMEAGKSPHIIGGAKDAKGIDAVRAIEEAYELALRL